MELIQLTVHVKVDAKGSDCCVRLRGASVGGHLGLREPLHVSVLKAKGVSSPASLRSVWSAAFFTIVFKESSNAFCDSVQCTRCWR